MRAEGLHAVALGIDDEAVGIHVVVLDQFLAETLGTLVGVVLVESGVTRLAVGIAGDVDDHVVVRLDELRHFGGHFAGLTVLGDADVEERLLVQRDTYTLCSVILSLGNTRKPGNDCRQDT